ncbi:hypothetical protein D3C76_749950 [compost metagenome]
MPAAHLQHTVEVLQHQARERRAHQACERRRQEQHRGDAPAIVLREPQRQVIQHAWGKTRFHRTNHETQGVELPFAVDEDHERGGQAPGHHDPGNPATGADLVQHHVAWHFENHITDHEQSGAEAVGGVAQAQVGLQLKLGKADVDAVEKREQVANHDQRHQAPGDLADQGFFFIVVNGRARAGLQCIQAHCGSPGGLPLGCPIVFVVWLICSVNGPPNVGAGLLAKAECQSTSLLNVRPYSRASPLPQGGLGVVRRARGAGRNCVRPWPVVPALRGQAAPASLGTA